MADNHLVKDGNGSNLTLRSTDNAGIFTPHTNANLRVADADVGGGNPVPVTGALTDTQLRLSPGPVSRRRPTRRPKLLRWPASTRSCRR